jgi:transposase-like protein
VERRWPDGIRCVCCGSDHIATRKPSARRLTPVYHCNDCKKDFTVKTNIIMHDSRLPLRKWALAFYLFSTNLKGVSSMKLHRDLGITQKAAWHLAHRIRETWKESDFAIKA